MSDSRMLNQDAENKSSESKEPIRQRVYRQSVIANTTVIAETKEAIRNIENATSRNRSYTQWVITAVQTVCSYDFIKSTYRLLIPTVSCSDYLNLNPSIPFANENCMISLPQPNLLQYALSIIGTCGFIYNIWGSYKRSSYNITVQNSMRPDEVEEIKRITNDNNTSTTLNTAKNKLQQNLTVIRKTFGNRPAALTFFIGSHKSQPKQQQLPSCLGSHLGFTVEQSRVNNTIAEFLGCDDLPFRAEELSKRKRSP